jgi:hypothetical protein
MAKPNLMGATFAERAAAAAGVSSFEDPTPENPEPQENTTFAQRAKASKKSNSKAVASESTENKAVAKKTAAKK